MKGEQVPLIVLGGSDGKPSVLPPRGEGKHPLTGYKGVDIRLEGRPLVQHVIERFGRLDRFHPVYLAGPARLYRDLVSVPVIDTDGRLDENVFGALDWVVERHPGQRIAFTASDVVPTPEDLAELVECYDRHIQSDLFFPLIRVPDDPGELGAFAWKPTYGLIPEPGADPVRVLPGHVAVVDPAALRLTFLRDLVRVAYRTRNRPIAGRRSSMLREAIMNLLYHDLLHILVLRVPNRTFSVLRSGFKVASGLRRGDLLRSELERATGRLAIKWRHRRKYRGRGVRLPILNGLSLAQDIDTEEEAQELGAVLERD